MATPPGVGDDDASLMVKNGRLDHRRKSSDETEQASRRSSQQSQHDHSGSMSDPLAVALNEAAVDTAAGAADDADDGTDGAESSPGTDHSLVDGWEVLGEQGGIRRDDEMERPVSPGVDFSSLYTYSKEEGEEGEEETVSKWLDAGEIHSFLVRGPTYLQVRRSSLSPLIIFSRRYIIAGACMSILQTIRKVTASSPGIIDYS